MAKRIPLPEPEKGRSARLRWVCGLAFVLVAAAWWALPGGSFLPAPVFGQVSVSAAGPVAVSADEPPPDNTSIPRGWVVVPEGVYLIVSPEIALGISSPGLGYLIYWWDYDRDEVYVFDRLAVEKIDLGQAVMALRRDLDVDYTRLIRRDDTLNEALVMTGEYGRIDGAWGPAEGEVVLGMLREAGADATMEDVDGIHRSVEDMMSMLASHPSPNFGADAPVPPGIDLGDGGSVQIPRGEGPGIEDPEACICCLVPVEQDPESIDPDGGGLGSVRSERIICCSNGACSDGDPCTVNDACGGPYGGGCVNGDCCGSLMPCPKGPCDRRAYCEGGVCVREPKICEDDGNVCTADECANGDCHPPLSGIPCGTTTNVCTKRECEDGACVTKDANEGGLCDDDGNPCTRDVCRSGSCTKENIDDIPCPDEDPPNVCTWNLCKDGDCDAQPIAGSCETDDNECTLDLCVSGHCDHLPFNEGAECEADEDPCIKHVCNDSGGCTIEPDNEGGTCDDEPNECTDDICQGGSCTHPAKDDETPCTPDATDCTRDVCLGGGCAHPPTNNNEPCESDDEICTVDLCDNGTCGHDTPVGDGTPCEDETPPDPCTDDICQGTTCDHPPKCPISDGPCVKECCVNGACRTDHKAQPCAFSGLDDGAGCRGSTIVLDGILCNTGTCVKTFALSAQQTGGAATLQTVTPSGGGSIAGQACMAVSVTVEIAGDSSPGEATVELTAESQSDGTCDPPVALSCSILSTLTVYVVDLDGDGNHDGVIEPEGADDILEDILPGIITLCNVDDDDLDGVRDNEGANAATIDDGAGVDGDDLAEVVLRAMPNLPQNWKVTLTLHTPANTDPAAAGAGDVVRVFSHRIQTAHTTAILGPGSTSFVLPDDQPHDVDLAALRAGDISLWVEGLQFAAEVKLRVILEDDMGTLMCDDEIQLKVAPLLLQGHLDPPVESFVSQINVFDPNVTADSATYCTQRFPNATPTGVVDTIISPPENGFDDPWAQDEYQLGFQQAPYKDMRVVLDSERDRGLHPFPPTLLGVDFGHIQIGSTPPQVSTRDAFGNLEVSPPCSANGVDYPLGRIYYGFNNSGLPECDQMDGDLRQFLTRQEVQSPVWFDTDWLFVGHVDEFMSIVPNSMATHGWTVLLADPALALDILRGDALVSGGVALELHIPRYKDYNRTHPPIWTVDTIQQILSRPIDSSSTVSIEDFNGPSGSLHGLLAALKAEIIAAFGFQQSEDFMPVPVLFNTSTQSVDCQNNPIPPPAYAITPNLANGAVYDLKYIAPSVFLRAFDTTTPPIEEDTVDPNFKFGPGETDLNGNGKLDTLRDPFEVWLAQNMVPGVTVEFIDDWIVYHLGDGEVHCSSNELRTLPSTKWWQVAP